ncbi:MAG: hypothetical protein ACYDCL_19885 [Myxococcales bacterium]
MPVPLEPRTRALLGLAGALALAACSGPPSDSCQTTADCPARSVCSQGRCLLVRSSSAASTGSSGGGPGTTSGGTMGQSSTGNGGSSGNSTSGGSSSSGSGSSTSGGSSSRTSTAGGSSSNGTGSSSGGSSSGGSSSSGSSSSGSSSSGSSSGGSSSSGTTGGSSTGGSSSTSTTGSSGSCVQGQPCTPTNVCDEGAVDCSSGIAVCQDQGSANGAQTGATCGPGAVCEGSQCLQPVWPLVPNQGNGVLTSPNLVVLTYSDDPNAASLQADAAWMADGGYLPLVAGQYGVGDGTVQFVDLGPSSGAPTGTTTNPNAFPSYFQSLFNAGTLPADALENLYILYLPSSWADTQSFCQSAGGYHTYFVEPNGEAPVYAIIPNCQGPLSEIEYAASHEVIEAATDPYIGSWTMSPDSPWYYLGGELGDMCAYVSQDVNGPYTATLIWSNQQAAAGGIPCQPWPAGSTYVSLLAPTTMATALPGSNAQVTVTGFASAPYPAWNVTANDNPVGWAQFATSPNLSSSTIAAGQPLTVTLSVPASALGGQSGAAWLTCTDSSTGASLGTAMVGVTAGCVATAGCADLTTVCYPDGGAVDSCAPNVCAPSAAPFSACSSQGTDDGSCLPLAPGYALCLQDGTLAAGSTGCLSQRSGNGSLASFCSAGSYCFGYATPTCLALCGLDAGAGCAAGDDCVALSQAFGVCAADCSTGASCPSGQTCYPQGNGQSACLP